MGMFKHLFTPTRIGAMELKNRIIMPPMGTGITDPDGTVNERFIAYHVARAKGGAALNTTEITYIDPGGQGIECCPAIWDDRLIPGLSELANAIPAYGGKLSIQLHHAGRNASSSVMGVQPVGYRDTLGQPACEAQSLLLNPLGVH